MKNHHTQGDPLTRKAKRSSAADHDGSGLLGSVFGRRAFAMPAVSGGDGESGAPSSARRRLLAGIATLALTITATVIAAAPALAAPQMGAISEVSYGSAHVTGTVTGESFLNAWAFEACTQECSVAGNWHVPEGGSGQFFGISHNEVPVEATIKGLGGGTEYFVRLTGNGSTSPAAPPYLSFTPLVADPTEVVSIAPASEVAYTTAKATGVIDRPVKSDNVACHFDYVTDQQFTENLGNSAPGFQGAGEAPCDTGNPGETPGTIQATGHVPVGAELPGLANATTYHLRLVVKNAATSDAKEAPNFTTLTVEPPSVKSVEDATGVEYSQAEVEGVVERPSNADPAFDIAPCNFEYVTDEQFATNPSGEEFAGAAQMPCETEPPENPIHASGQTTVKAHLGGLAPQTTYHLRLSATNLGGTDSEEAADTFTTEGPVPPPVVISIQEASEVTIHTATAEGVVERPAGKDPALDVNCRFEYISDAQFQANPPGEEFAGAGQAGCIQNPITEGTVGPDGTEAVRAELGALRAGTAFHLRLVAEDAVGGVDTEEAATFATLEAEKPIVSIDPIAEEVFTTAHVTGTIGEGQGSGPITGFFEISSDGGATWSHASNPDAQGVGVQQHVFTGLQPATTYLLRLSAWHDRAEGLQAPFELGEVAFSPVLTVTTEPLAPPTVVLDPVTGISANGAHLSGSVDTNAPPGPFSDNAKAAYRTEWHFQCNPECSQQPGLSGTVTAEEGSQAISTDVKHLDANTHYEVRLVAKNALETPVEPARTFDTSFVAPTVTALPGGPDGEGGYTLAGIVNPNNSPVTACEFKWGPNSAGYAFAAPCSPPAGAGAKPVTVEAHLSGLNPGAVYHFRLLATNGAGTGESNPDQEFTPTLAVKGPECPNEQLRGENNSLGLPECRAYEMVTDPDKEGKAATTVDFDGGAAVSYVSGATNIADSGSGSFVKNIYVARRTPVGWETIPDLNGPAGSIFAAPEYAALEYPAGATIVQSADLLSSIWALRKKDSPSGPYLRRPDGMFEQVGVGTLITTGGQPDFALASDTLSHLVLMSGTSYATSWGPGVYEFVGTGNDQPRQVDVDNNGSSLTGCTATSANKISADGRVIVFTLGCGGIWARVDGTTSYDLSSSRCNRAAPGELCNAPAPATYRGSAKDGSRVYFTTEQQLVDGDTDETNDLYACDIPTTPQDPIGTANPCSALHEVSAGTAGKADVQKVLTVSDDGSTAYFTAKGVLAHNDDALGEEAVEGNENLYVWRTDAVHPDGQTSFVAGLPEGETPVAETTPDGRYLVLQTAGPLASTDTDESADIYRYDSDTGEIARVSTAVSGAGGNGESGASITAPGTESPPTYVHNSHPAISDDGKLIVFATEEALSPLDGNGESDAYLWNDGHALGSVAPLLPGVFSGSQNTPGHVSIDGSGQDIYIQTAARLNPTDIDAATDVYDARIGGGFPQHQEGCAGETCQPGAAPASSMMAPSSEQPGSGNPSQPRRCPKGKVKKHGKCVKKSHGKHHKKKGKGHSKKAGHNRGGSK